MSSSKDVRDAQDIIDAAALLAIPSNRLASKEEDLKQEDVKQEGSLEEDDQQQAFQQQDTQQQDSDQAGSRQEAFQQKGSQQEASQPEDSRQEGSQQENWQESSQQENSQQSNDQQERTQQEEVQQPSHLQRDGQAPGSVWLVEELWSVSEADPHSACQRTLGVFMTVEAANQYAEDFVHKVQRLTKRDEAVNLVDEESEKKTFAEFAGTYSTTDMFQHDNGSKTWIVNWRYVTTVSVLKKRVWREGEEKRVVEPLWNNHIAGARASDSPVS